MTKLEHNSKATNKFKSFYRNAFDCNVYSWEDYNRLDLYQDDFNKIVNDYKFYVERWVEIITGRKFKK